MLAKDSLSEKKNIEINLDVSSNTPPPTIRDEWLSFAIRCDNKRQQPPVDNLMLISDI